MKIMIMIFTLVLALSLVGAGMAMATGGVALPRWVVSSGAYEVSQGKTDTYSVEGDNAELRHYLARLVRRSRCFSRCPEALQAALKLFMYGFNRRQLHKQLFPHYPAHVFQFV